MGLDVSHDCWHGPYSSFARFREQLANCIGTNLNNYEGYGGTVKFSTLQHDLEPLLNHSDCDGTLSPDECERIIKGLNSILPNVPPECEDLKKSIVQFRDGCQSAVDADEDVYFH